MGIFDGILEYSDTERDTRGGLFPAPNQPELWIPWQTRAIAEKHRAMVARDSQRTRAYSWDREINGNAGYTTSMTKQEVNELVRKVFTEYGLPVPQVYHSTRRGRTCSWRAGYLTGRKRKAPRIKMQDWGRNVNTVLHECAHGLNDYADVHRAGHGAEWVAIYITLMVQYAGKDEAELRRKAREHGLKVA